MHSPAQPHAASPNPAPDPDSEYESAEAPPEEAAPGPDFEALKSRAQQAIDRSSTWIREHPAAAVGIAVASGFFVGRVLRK